jgi:hypothetical protein
VNGLEAGAADAMWPDDDPLLTANDESKRLVSTPPHLGQVCCSSALEAEISFSKESLHV